MFYSSDHPSPHKASFVSNWPCNHCSGVFKVPGKSRKPIIVSRDPYGLGVTASADLAVSSGFLRGISA